MKLVLVQMLHYTLTLSQKKKGFLRLSLQRSILAGNLYTHVGILCGAWLFEKEGTLPYLPSIQGWNASKGDCGHYRSQLGFSISYGKRLYPEWRVFKGGTWTPVLPRTLPIAFTTDEIGIIMLIEGVDIDQPHLGVGSSYEAGAKTRT